MSVKDCFRKAPEMKPYLIAFYGLLYYEEECFFGSGAVNGLQHFQYIEAYCIEEAKNLYRVLNSEFLDIDNPAEELECLGVYSEECEEPPCDYVAFSDRPKEYQRQIYHIGDVRDIFAITEKQWEAIKHLSEATKSKFTGITKKEASEFISKKIKEVSEWKKAHSGRRNYNRAYSRPRYNPDDQAEWENDCCISWLDLCGDM